MTIDEDTGWQQQELIGHCTTLGKQTLWIMQQWKNKTGENGVITKKKLN